MQSHQNKPTSRSAGSKRPSRTATPHRRTTTASARTASRTPLIGGAVVVAVVFLLIGIAFGLSRCGTATETDSFTPYVSPYDWNGLEWGGAQGDRLAYYEGDEQRSTLGVDVSDHQGAVDWQAVAADGIDFAMVRVGNRGYTEGALYADERYAENLDGAAGAGLETGAYFFSQAVNEDEAHEEAEFVLELLDGRNLSMPVVFDHEPVTDAAGRANNLDRDTLTACALAFCTRIEQAGYATMVYGNKGDMGRYDTARLGDRPVWFAEYDVQVPSAQFDFAIWQYTNGGTVAGINTAVDLNLRMTDAR